MDNKSQFEDFDLNLYEEIDYSEDGSVQSYSSWGGTNSSTSIACSLLTNVTEGCNWC
ncbi:hypothetical protein P4U05_16550 [Bacillus paranthracis]|uniref:hypothetical protein n=1 Tax=Bacillus paranthracis TaxID=2026186 RepID=UPI000200F77F|nr:hypothetical protein [Bacillus paranthracis]ADY20440.1 hypothetical protein YBT020_05970 [Bacillus thuringiensis serovar finitimus YBT-020]MRC72917.1 hypothetical protein [Bacillus thuringiensis]MCR6799291.1 hypothetical protein [Bacillus paranthracis]MEC3358550.1 hypothetical protein [Bacillus paranthracis]MED0785545.1 hypothetical protein [Bacillus paranthracis]